MTKKKFIRIIIYIALFLILIDRSVAWSMSLYMRHKDIPGDYSKIEYMRKHVNAQILLLGASTCMNSINPDVLEKELGKSVFNGGLNDQRLEFFDIMSEKTLGLSPSELLILVLRQNDLVTSSSGRLPMMNIYYHQGNKKLDTYLNEGKLKKKLLLNSALYKFNTFWWRFVLYHFKSFNELAHGGFVGKPIPKTFPQYPSSPPKNVNYQLNRQKLHCLENILMTCRKSKTKLWIVITPELNKYNYGGVSYIQEFCNNNSVPFFNDSQHQSFIDHPEYFYDNAHLNINGAQIYTSVILERLQKNGF